MPPTTPTKIKHINPANPLDIPLPGPRDWAPGPRLEWPDGRYDALEAYLDPTPQGRSRHTSVVIQNDTLAERNAVIVCAGAHFIYSDLKMLPAPPGAPKKPAKSSASITGSKLDPYGLHLDYMSGPTDVEVYAGNATAFRSTDPRRSVIEVRIAVKVRFGYDGRPPYHTTDFVAYYNPTEMSGGSAGDPLLIIGDVFFEFRAKDAISKPTPRPTLPVQFGPASPAGYFELRKSLAR